MILINIETLSDSELKYIAKQENLENWESLSRESIIEQLQDIYDDMESDRGLSSEKYVKTLTTTPSDNVLQFPGTSELPEKYNETSVYMVLRDPDWAYVFWSISEEKLSELKSYGEYSLVLRNKAVFKDGKEETFEIEVSSSDNNWNVELPFKDAVYSVELCAKVGLTEQRLCFSGNEESRSSYLANDTQYLKDKRTIALCINPLISKNGSLVTERTISDLVNTIKED